MMLTLVRKEISEHWLATCALLMFLGVCSLLISLYMAFLEAGSVLDAHRFFMAIFVVLAALFVTNRLVAREYRGQTQLFLEALPVTRPAMITVKLILGVAGLCAVSLLNLCWLLVLGSQTEPITPLFVGILTLRTVGFAAFVYLFAFMMSMLGRYKIPIYLALFIGLMVFLEVTGFELGRFGPIGLIWDRMEYETVEVPWSQLGIAAAICIGLLTMIYALAVVREGALAGMLAEKMSQREKLFVTACLLVSLAASNVVTKMAAPEPFELFDMQVATVGRVQVATSHSEELSKYLADQLDTLCQYLNIDRAPKVWITDRTDLDVHRFERGELKDHRSLLLRANLTHPRLDRQSLAAFMIHEFLDVHTQGRVKTEAKMWYWDGLGVYWMHRHQLGQDGDKVALRAAVAFKSQPLTSDLVRYWRKYRLAVGEDLAQATAAEGIACLVQQCGEPASQGLLSKLFQGDVGDDFRATWFEYRHSNEQLFSQHASMTYQNFVDAWLKQLAQISAAHGAEVDASAAPIGTCELVHAAEKSQLHYILSDSVDKNAFPALLYMRLKPFVVEPAPHDVQRFDMDVQSPEGKVDVSLDRGDAVLATLRVFDHKLGCERISGWKVYPKP